VPDRRFGIVGQKNSTVLLAQVQVQNDGGVQRLKCRQTTNDVDDLRGRPERILFPACWAAVVYIMVMEVLLFDGLGHWGRVITFHEHYR
jgi:hypothetical protein